MKKRGHTPEQARAMLDASLGWMATAKAELLAAVDAVEREVHADGEKWGLDAAMNLTLKAGNYEHHAFCVWQARRLLKEVG